MTDLPGLILSFSAILLAGVSVSVELMVPPRRKDWKGFLVTKMIYFLFLTAVFLMYLAAGIPAVNKPEVFNFLRSLTYLSNPLLVWAFSLWLEENEVLFLSSGIRLLLFIVNIFFISADLIGLGFFTFPVIALFGVLGGRVFLLGSLIVLFFRTVRKRHRVLSITLLSNILFWLGLTVIEIILDRFPERLPLLNIWYIGGAVLFCLWAYYSIITRRLQFHSGQTTIGGKDLPNGSELSLTRREKEIARELLEGKSYQEIGETLFISYGTVKTHVYRIYKKLGVSNKIELMQAVGQIGRNALSD